jgi:hypothetical protein
MIAFDAKCHACSGSLNSLHFDSTSDVLTPIPNKAGSRHAARRVPKRLAYRNDPLDVIHAAY